MSDWINMDRDSKHVSAEKQRAKKLKKSQWWQSKVNLGECHYCQEIIPPRELTMDHVVPVSRGGKSIKGNVVPCCKSCNSDKKYLTPAEIVLNEIRNKEEGQARDYSGQPL